MNVNDKCCICCKHFDDALNECNHESGILKGIQMSEGLANATHDCLYFDEVTYTLTPKGCLKAAFIKARIDDDEIFEEVWDDFEKTMKKLGYVHEEDE